MTPKKGQPTVSEKKVLPPPESKKIYTVQEGSVKIASTVTNKPQKRTNKPESDSEDE